MADAPDFRVDNQRIAANADYVFSRDPVNFIRLFWVADRSNMPIHPATTRLITSLGIRADYSPFERGTFNAWG